MCKSWNRMYEKTLNNPHNEKGLKREVLKQKEADDELPGTSVKRDFGEQAKKINTSVHVD